MSVDNFAMAAAGNADAQDLMAHVAVSNFPDLNHAPDAELWIAHVWTNMALVNGNLAVRWFRVRLLSVLAPRCQAQMPERAKALITDAIAMLFELAAEGDADAVALLPRALDAINEDYGRCGREQVVKAAGELANARAAALLGTSSAIQSVSSATAAATVH